MIANEQWGCLMRASSLFARQKLFILHTVGALLAPPPGGEHSVPVPALPWLNSPWAALICMHTAFLTEHSTQARKEGGEKKKKGREKETKSYFYGKLRSDCGAIFQVHLNKSIKAYPNTKGGRLRLPLPPLLFAVYIWQSKLRPGACASVYLKQTEHR